MRPSQYHYIKRIWTRNMNGCRCKFFSNIFLLPLKVVWWVLLSGFYIVFGIPYWIIKCICNLLRKNETISCRKTEVKKEGTNIFYEKKKEEQNNYMLYDGKELIAHKLKKVNSLAKVINTTCDFEEFVNSYEKLIKQLQELSVYEKDNFFVDSTPSKDLERILKNKAITEKEFIDRYINKYGIEELENKKQYLYFFSIEAISYFNLQLENRIAYFSSNEE